MIIISLFFACSTEPLNDPIALEEAHPDASNLTLAVKPVNRSYRAESLGELGPLIPVVEAKVVINNGGTFVALGSFSDTLRNDNDQLGVNFTFPEINTNVYFAALDAHGYAGLSLLELEAQGMNISDVQNDELLHFEVALTGATANQIEAGSAGVTSATSNSLSVTGYTGTWLNYSSDETGGLSTELNGATNEFSVLRKVERIGPDGQSHTGLLATRGNVVISLPEAGAPEVVAQLNSNINGLWAGHLDRDGTTDAAIWTDEQLILLRGRPAGGYSWGAQFTANTANLTSDAETDQTEDSDNQTTETDSIATEARSIVSVNIGEFSGDGHNDVSIATTTETKGLLVILQGNGSWQFSEAQPLELLYPVGNAVVADENDDGLAEITVLDAEKGYVRRYTDSIEGWIGGLPSLLDPDSYVALPGAKLPHPQDINGDGRLDLIIEGGRTTSNESQDLVFFVINTAITKYDQSFTHYSTAYIDNDENGSTDILALSQDALHITSYDIEDSTYSVRNLNIPTINGPLIAEKIDADSLASIRIANSNIFRVNGTQSSAGAYILDRVLWTDFETILEPLPVESGAPHRFHVGDFNGDGSTELIGFRLNNDKIKIHTWEFQNNDTKLEQLHILNIGEVSALDLITCGSNIYSLEATDNSSRLRLLQLNATELTNRKSRYVDHERLDCTKIGNNELVLTAVGDDVYKVFRGDNLDPIDTGEQSEWKDAAIGDLDGDGQHDVRGCTASGCDVDMADLDGDGIDELIIANSAGITVKGWNNEIPVTGTQFTTSDLNGDGKLELLTRHNNSNWITVYMAGDSGNARGGLLHPQALLVEGVYDGLPKFFDLDSDGRVEQLTIDEEGNTRVSYLQSEN